MIVGGHTHFAVEVRSVKIVSIDEMRSKGIVKFAMMVNIKCLNDIIPFRAH